MSEKPDAFSLKGFENVACAMYFAAHYEAHNRLVAEDLAERDPEQWPTIKSAYATVMQGDGETKRKGHMNLCIGGLLGDLSAEDIPNFEEA